MTLSRGEALSVCWSESNGALLPQIIGNKINSCCPFKHGAELPEEKFNKNGGD